MFRFLLVAALVGCTGSSEPSASSNTSASTSTRTPSEHAAADAEPGSHEDWCGEHGVPESQCTRCNPDLIPAFKATGDWCDEHGLPDSQCTTCSPDLVIERPPKDG